MSIHDVLNAFHEYSLARGEHDAAERDHDGYSWDYFGADYIKAMDDAAAKAEKAMKAYINNRIGAHLSKRRTK